MSPSLFCIFLLVSWHEYSIGAGKNLSQNSEVFTVREITKTLMIPADGKSMEFRLTKLDAFSGASLLRILSRLPAGEDFLSFLTILPDEDLRRLMTV